MASKIHRNSLKHGYKLHWYEIKEILGQGGFGITYLAYDANLEKHVAIKEYLPIELSVREGDFSVHPVSENHGKQYAWGLDRFITEARNLAQFDHPNIVRVLSVTEENNTAYMVMAYEHGQTLQEKLKGKKTLEEAELLKIFIPILGGLEIVHKAGFIHRDIKPDNIFIREDGSPVLLDFGSARQALGEQTKTLTSLVSPGYAPFEQYFSKSDEQGEWTDIYSLGATLYRAIAGVTPQDAVDRSNAILKTSKDVFVTAIEIGKGKYSERFLKAIDHAIQFRAEDRPKTIAEWKSEFDLPDNPIQEAIAVEQQVTQPGQTVLARQQQTKHISRKTIVLVTLFILTVVAVYFQKDISQLTQSKYIATQQLKDNEQDIERQQKITEDKLITEKKIKQEKEAAEQERKAAEEKVRQEAEQQQLAELQAQQRIATEAEERLKEKQIQTLFSQAEEDIAALRLTSPADNNALYRAKRIGQLEPGHSKVNELKNMIVGKYLTLARQAGDKDEFDKAFARLDKAEAIMPDAENIQFARETLTTAKQQEEEQQRLAGEEKRRKDEAERLAEEQHLAEQERLNKKIKAKQITEEKQRVEDEAAELAESKRLVDEEAASKVKNAKAGEFIKIPGGTLAISGESVNIKPFEMGKYEVTQGQWRYLMGDNPSHFKNCGEKCPVENVKWDDVQEFIKKLNTETGVKYRLPTAAEWEYACAVGGREDQCKGSNIEAIYMMRHSKSYPVGQTQPNHSGIYNLTDNVWEWTCSVYSPTSGGRETECENTDKYAIHAIRGGKKIPIDINSKSALRNWNHYATRFQNIGFRLVVSK